MAARFRIRAVTLATYNPDLDQGDKTLRAGLRIIELPAGCAGGVTEVSLSTTLHGGALRRV